MSGWSLPWALVNFAILAAGLFLIGKKIVLRLYLDHRNSIAEGLSRAETAGDDAKEILSVIPAAEEKGRAERDEIMTHARETAEKRSGTVALENEQRRKEALALAKSGEERLISEMRRELCREAAEKVSCMAGELIGRQGSEADQKLRARFIGELPSFLVPTAAERMLWESGKDLFVTVTSAAELSEREKTAILDSIEEKYKIDPADCRFTVDPSVLGGVIVRIGDSVYDGSLAATLRHTADELGGGDRGGAVVSDMKGRIAALSLAPDCYQAGSVISLSDGICRVSGLSDAMAGEMLQFDGDLRGMVMDLDSDNVGVVLLGNYDNVQAGDPVRRTGHIIEVPVGEALIGRVVDALGRPVDGKGEILTNATRPIESPAPGVIERKSVSVPMQTGIKAIDALVPIGRGQRELIIGDRQTGKTSIALDTILNQKGKDMICIYVAIGQKESTVASFVSKLQSAGAMDYSIIVCANAGEPAPMLYIAPYAGAAIGEYFMYSGRDVLIIYDDLSKHAVAYREISLLLHRPPGREAYPGDVFYLHSRLLERAARLDKAYGGGSMTALPIIETQAGDISAYIPTNVISITDGQIFLETELFNSGVRPAVNVGLSVSRVGGSAQPGAMKQVAGRLRMELAQYRELAAFSQLGSDLDKTTRATLRHGERMTELLKQPLYAPKSATDQIIAIFAANEGFFDDKELADVAELEKELVASVRESFPELEGLVNTGKKLDREQLDRLRAAIVSFRR